MSPEVRALIEADILCACGQCEEAVQDILRMESMLCRGGKYVLTKRRKEVQRALRRPYYRRRYAAAREQ